MTEQENQLNVRAESVQKDLAHKQKELEEIQGLCQKLTGHKNKTRKSASSGLAQSDEKVDVCDVCGHEEIVWPKRREVVRLPAKPHVAFRH